MLCSIQLLSLYYRNNVKKIIKKNPRQNIKKKYSNDNLIDVIWINSIIIFSVHNIITVVIFML